MTGADNSLFPMRRPWWVVVLLGMILFGYIQEDAKVKLNHYIAIGEQFTDFYEYGREECEGEAQCMYEKRKAWWDDYSPLCRASASPNRETFSVFHWWGAQEMLRAKWVLMVLIVLGFFLLDALFLIPPAHRPKANDPSKRPQTWILIRFLSMVIQSPLK